jgi:acyl carrier protein
MVFEKVREIISEQLNMGIKEIKLDTSFKDDLNADSLDIFQIIMAIEETFELEIASEDIEDISTVRDVVDFIKAHSELD